ncbi:ubiquinol oxidase subunit II [Falsirhodobacter halotolerans]|uniref:ubiquinol oxidase subunit II n=1 Tax=Falsirhodobacter halotolerans TaxID=1146892 RepID=UPI001FD00C21|nr:ubiquinol oxidase subunit II [Falsirhodobacter halotolerans]
MKSLRLAALAPLLLIAACKPVVLAPAGDVAAQQRDVLVISTLLMLLIIIPVIALVIYIAWKYRASNQDAEYDPKFHHSTRLELIIWAAPLLIIICLGALTWVGTHLLDPYRPLDRISKNTPIEADYQPLRVQVVAMDWKWMFIYPEEGIATINELAVPVDRPVEFSMTATSVMNTLYIPAMAGMIYAMPAMETKLNGVLNNEGVYDGFSAHYSGHGFSHMRFKAHAMQPGDYDAWVEQVRAEGSVLDRAVYTEVERPSEAVPVTYYSTVEPGLWHAILNRCVNGTRMCMDEMMALDSLGGFESLGMMNVTEVTQKVFTRGKTPFGSAPVTVDAFCTVLDSERVYGSDQLIVAAKDSRPLRGHGLQTPGHPLTPVITLLTAPKGAQAL